MDKIMGTTHEIVRMVRKRTFVRFTEYCGKTAAYDKWLTYFGAKKLVIISQSTRSQIEEVTPDPEYAARTAN